MADTSYTLRHWTSKTEYTDNTLQPQDVRLDDKTAHVHAVAATLLGVPRVYMWVHTIIQDRVTFIRELVEAIFQKRSHVVYDIVYSSFLTVFPEAALQSNYGRAMRLSQIDAYNLLYKNAPNVVQTPLCYELKTVVGLKHIFPTNPFGAATAAAADVSVFDMSSLIIHDHFPLDNIINVVTQDAIPDDTLYFPKDIILSNQVKKDPVYDHVSQHLSKNFIMCDLKRVRYEVKPIGAPQQINLRSIFTAFSLDTATPIVKMQNGTDIVYKVDSDAIKLIPPDRLEEFTKVYSKQKKIAFYVAIMLFVGEHYAKLTFSALGTYELKVSFENVTDKSESYVWNTIAPYVNHTLHKIQGILVNPLLVCPMLTKEMVYTNSCCSEIITRTLFTFTKVQNIQAIEAKILKLSNIFHKNYSIIHKAHNKLAVRYRRCSTLNPDFDVAAFIQSKLDTIPRYELADMLIEMFGMTRERASSRINEVSSITMSPFTTGVHNDGVTIEITRTNDMELVVFVKGSFLDKEMIVHILRVFRTCLDGHVPTAKVITNTIDNDTVKQNFFDSDSDSDSDFDSDNKIFKDEDADLVTRSTSPDLEPDVTLTSTVNAKRYTIKRLQDADPVLFNYTDANFKSYAMNCAANERRQPIVVPKDEVSKFKKESYTNAAVLGGNAYICPQVWCTHSQIPMSLADFTANKCPSPLDTAIHLHDKGAKKYIGFLDPSKHPQEACVPCCFLVDHTTKSSGKLKGRFGKCMGAIDTGDTSTSQEYIKAETVFPLEVGRYGRIPANVSQHLGVGVIVRKGIAHKGRYFMSCMEAALHDSTSIEDCIVKNIQPHDFIAIPNLVRDFIDTTSNIMHDVNYFNFRKWFLKQRAYIQLYGLQKLEAYARTNVSPESLAPPLLWELKREFIVYVAMMQFLHYIRSDSPKDLRILPLFAKPWLNTSNDNIIIYDDITDGVAVHCVTTDRMSDKYVLILKHEKFYEQLCELSSNHERLVFDSDHIAVTSVLEAIASSKTKSDNHALVAKLREIGHPMKKQVVNVDFYLSGVITTSGVYVSFPPGTREPIAPGVPCVYMSMAHEWASPQVKSSVFSALGYTGTLGNLDMTDLHIFTGVQLQNPVTEFMVGWNEKNAAFNGGVKAIVIEIMYKEPMLKEFEFLRNPNNFFSRAFKTEMMAGLIRRTRASRTVPAEFVPRMADVILTRDTVLLTSDVYPERATVYMVTQEQVNRGELYALDPRHTQSAVAAPEAIRPMRFQALLPSGFVMANVDLYDIFGEINADFADKSKAVDYVFNTIEEIVPEETKYHPVLQDTSDSHVMLEIMSGPAYRPGVMEAKILAIGANVGLVVIGTRKDLDVPAPSKIVIKPQGSGDKYIVLHYDKDSVKWKIIFDGSDRFVYTSDELVGVEGLILD